MIKDSALRVMVIGAGGRGRIGIDYFSRNPDWKLVALVDGNEEILQDAVARLKGEGMAAPVCFSDAQQALAQVDVDALYIASPTRTHAQYARLGFTHGKHVLVEKAMTIDWEEALALVQEGEEVCFCVAQNFRYARHCQALIEAVRDVDSPWHPGKVEMVDLVHHHYRPRVQNLTFEFGMVWDITSHHIDLLQAALPARFEQLRAEAFKTSWSPYPYAPNLRAWFDLEGPVRIQYLLSFDATAASLCLTLCGDRGTLLMNGRREVLFYPKGNPIGTAPLVVPQNESNSACGFAEVVEAWRHYILHGEEPSISARQNLQILNVCQGVTEAIRSKECYLFDRA